MKKGISLVALVITIIVLIILTAAVILTATNTNIFEKAGEARDAKNRQEVFDAVQREILDTQLEMGGQGISQEFATKLQQKLNTKYPQANAQASYANGKITIGYTLNGKEYTLELNDKMSLVMKDETSSTPGGGNGPETIDQTIDEDLVKYILGPNKTGRSLTEIMNFSTGAFIDEPGTMPNANEEIQVIYAYNSEYDEEDGVKMVSYIKYENAAYRVDVDSNYNMTGLTKVYEPSGDEGKTVRFSVDGTSPAINWLILYDNGDTIDIMSINTMGSLVLGDEDKSAGMIKYQETLSDYNNAISILNNYCASLITNEDAITVRSVGSNPIFGASDTTQTYSSTNLATWYSGTYNNIAKIGDNNLEQDIVRMGYVLPEYINAGKKYWFASRVTYFNKNYPDDIEFCIRYMSNDDEISEKRMFSVGKEGVATSPITTDGRSCEVRPVVRVSKSNVSYNN